MMNGEQRMDRKRNVLGFLIAVLWTATASAAGQAQVAFAGNGQKLGEGVGRGVALADFNGDRALDAFVAHESGPNNQYGVYFGDGHGQFADSGQRLERPLSGAKPIVFDVDGDRDQDVLTGRTVWMNDGRGRFTPDTERVIDADGAGFWQSRLADLNNDGRTDLLAIVREGQETRGRVYLNDSQGRFRCAGPSFGRGILATLELGDVNGDGFIDAVMSGWRNAAADPCPNRIWLNDGQGRLTDSGQLFDEGLRHSHGLALGDLDRDGDLDFVLVTQQAPFARLYLNDGRGRFAGGPTLGTEAAEKVFLADLNGDGSLDIFLACIGPDEVWLNDGEGRFTDSRLRLGGDWSWEAAVGDVNGDGLPDLFVVNLGIDRAAPPEKMMKARSAEVWLNTSRK